MSIGLVQLASVQLGALEGALLGGAGQAGGGVVTMVTAEARCCVVVSRGCVSGVWVVSRRWWDPTLQPCSGSSPPVSWLWKQ